MNADNQNFEALRRLLKLKRHEKPPPRYFNDFSSQVLNRIRNVTPAEKEDLLEHVTLQSPWLAKVLGAFQTKPILAGLFGAAVCGLLVGGVVYSERMEANPKSADLAVSQPQPVAVPQAATFFGNDTSLAVSSTNPISPTTGSLFDAVRISTVPVNFKPGGN